MNENDNLLVCYDFIQRIKNEMDQEGKIKSTTKNQCEILVNGLNEHFKNSNINPPKTPKEKENFKTNFRGFQDIISVYEEIDLTDSNNDTKNDAKKDKETQNESKKSEEKDEETQNESKKRTSSPMETRLRKKAKHT